MEEEIFYKLLAKKLSGQLSDTEKNQLAELLANDENLRFKMAQLEKYWDTPMQTIDVEEQWKAHRQKISKITTNKNRKWLAAASVLVLVLLGAVLQYALKEPANKPFYTSIKTGIGLHKVFLPDSSVVVLNSNSVIQYDSAAFAHGNRSLNFEGEGYFDIHHDPQHPLSIHLKTGTVKVLGTAFNISSYPNDPMTAVSLIRGKVVFTDNRKNNKPIITLQPNERLVVKNNNTYKNNDPIQVQKFQDILVSGKHYVKDTTWMSDKIVMKNDRLDYILLQLEHKYGVTINVNDPLVSAYQYSGELGNSSLEKNLSALSIVHPFTYKENGKGAIDISK